MSWLSRFPNHRIFSLPLSTSTTDHDGDEHETSRQDGQSRRSLVDAPLDRRDGTLPTLNKLPSIFPPTSLARSARPSPTTPKFVAAASPASGGRNPRAPLAEANVSSRLGSLSDVGRGRVRERHVDRGRRNQRIVTIRGGTELIVAVGTELRIVNLKQVKVAAAAAAAAAARGGGRETRAHEEENDEDPDLGDYKVLNTPEITFDIHELVANQTGKLLAVVGLHSIRVIELPRKGWIDSTASSIDVRCLEIGKFYHSLPGSPRIAHTLWHPLGKNHSSLLVLTRDAIVREYTLHESAEEPSQTVSFFDHGNHHHDDDADGGADDHDGNTRSTTPGSSKARGRQRRGKGFFSAEDESSHEATAMCLGDSFESNQVADAVRADWGQLTLYGLMKNGDVKSICPFLPKRSTLSRTYLQGLSSFVSTKLDYLASASSSTTTSGGPLETPTKAMSLARSSDHPESLAAPSGHDSGQLETRYSLQLQYLQALLRQVPPRKASIHGSGFKSTSAGGGGAGSEAGDEDDESDWVDLTAPISRPNLSPRVQGPYLMAPSTTELPLPGGGGIDSFATDVVYLETKPRASTGRRSAVAAAEPESDGQSLGVLIVVYSDGKLEVCLEVEKPEARFHAEETSLVLRRGRSDVREEEPEDQGRIDDDDLPMLFVFETLDLGFTQEVFDSTSTKAVIDQSAKAALEDELDGGRSWPSLRRDDLYPQDTVWVYSNFGVECVVLGSAVERVWGRAIDDDKGAAARDVPDEDESQVYWAVKTRSTTTLPKRAQEEHDDLDSDNQPIVGFEVIHDMYLGYSIIAITPMLQLAGVELSLRVDPELLPSSSPLANEPRLVDSCPAPPAPNANGTRGYTSLLDTPFNVPSVFTADCRKTSSDRGRDETAALATITPDSLRRFGKHVETYQTRVRELVEGVDLVQMRLELQMKELGRQIDKLHQLNQTSRDLKRSTGSDAGAGGGGLVARMNRVETNQVALLERLDKALQRLMEKHQGRDKLSAYERKWFDELTRIEKQVRGSAAGGTRGGLEGKASRVEAMWQELRPRVETMVEKKREQQQQQRGDAAAGTPGRGGALGTTQIRALEGKLSDEAKLLSDAKRKVERLAHSLAATSI